MAQEYLQRKEVALKKIQEGREELRGAKEALIAYCYNGIKELMHRGYQGRAWLGSLEPLKLTGVESTELFALSLIGDRIDYYLIGGRLLYSPGDDKKMRRINGNAHKVPFSFFDEETLISGARNIGEALTKSEHLARQRR